MEGTHTATRLLARSIWVEKHFKWKGLTPTKLVTHPGDVVEKHFKWKGLTPLIGQIVDTNSVEKHFKN